MSRSNHYESPCEFIGGPGDYTREVKVSNRWVHDRRPYFRRTEWYRRALYARGVKARHLKVIDPHGRHPNWQALLWRQKYRAICARELLRDPDAMQIPPINKATEVYDWY